jgi:hypothetical protein
MDEPILWTHSCASLHVDCIELRLETRPNEISPQLTTSRGKVHCYIGSVVDYGTSTLRVFTRYFFEDHRDAVEFKLRYG